MEKADTARKKGFRTRRSEKKKKKKKYDWFGKNRKIEKLMHTSKSKSDYLGKIYSKMQHYEIKDQNHSATITMLGYIEDIMINILIRLSAKTLTACKTVAKHFLELISEPDFPLMHLAMSKRNMKYIICSYPVVRDNCNSLFIMEDGKISEDVSGSLPYFRIAEMNCFPNGLVCSVHEDKTRKMEIDIRIFNPITKDMIVLPRGSTSTVMPTVGVVIDPISYVYKAYRFFVDPAKTAGVNYMCEVYTAGSKEWRTVVKKVKNPCHSYYHPHCPFYASVAGVMYWFEWLDGGNPGIPVGIISVDMNDNFSSIDLPADLTNWSFLIEFGGGAK